MKKVLLNLVLVFSVFCLLGCGGKKEVDLVKIEKKFTEENFFKQTGINYLFGKDGDGHYISFSKVYNNNSYDTEVVTFKIFKDEVYEINIRTSCPYKEGFDRGYYPEYQVVKDRLDGIFSIIKTGINDEELIKTLEVVVEELKMNPSKKTGPDGDYYSDKKNYETSKFTIETDNLLNSKFIYITSKEVPKI